MGRQAYEVFAANLRKLLERHNYTQADFARAIGVTPGAVTHWLSARQGPNLGQLEDIARHFGLSVSAITNPKLAEAEVHLVTAEEALSVLAKQLGKEIRAKRNRTKAKPNSKKEP
jgi:transcriptional regulator with XRE-family HTH domain